MEGKKKATNKQLPEIKTWFNIDNPMNYNDAFVFMPGEAILWLPIGANKYLQKAIKYSQKTTLFTIQEDEFNEKDWSIITKGLIERKNSSTNLKISFTNLHKSNLQFIRDIIRRSDISELTFHDCAIEEGCFNSFCDAISNATAQLKKITITKNELTEEQIKKLEQVVSKIGKPLILYNSTIRSVTNQNQLKELASDYNRYVFEWMEELQLEYVNIDDPRLCYAVKMSPSLNTINIKNISNPSWKRMAKAIAGNKNIRSIKVNSGDFFILPGLPEIFSKAKITELELKNVSSLGYSTVIANNRSLKHLIVERLFRFSENSTSSSFLEAVKKHESLTALTTKFDKITSNQIVALLRTNPRISSLTIYLSEIQSDSRILQDILVPTLKELHLHASVIAGEANESHLIEAISKSKIEAFSFNGFMQFHDSKFQEILEKNRTIKKIDFTRSGMRPSDSMELLEHLKFHPTLTSFAFDLDPTCTAIFADILRTNTRLQHIGISLRTEKFNRHHITALKDAIKSNKYLRSFSTNVQNAQHAAFMLDLIEESTSVTSFKCNTVEWSDQAQEKLFLETTLKVLEHNNVLTDISIVRSWSIVQVDPTIQKMLKRNKDHQLQRTNNMLYFIGTMAARPQLYLSMLPLEVWSNIFKRISFPGVDLDFDKLLMKRFDTS